MVKEVSSLSLNLFNGYSILRLPDGPGPNLNFFDVIVSPDAGAPNLKTLYVAFVSEPRL